MIINICFGPDILVAPILFEGERSRKVYLPRGTNWRDMKTGNVHNGGQWLVAEAPIDTIPLFVRVGSEVMRFFK